jgi:hypothetical protein
VSARRFTDRILEPSQASAVQLPYLAGEGPEPVRFHRYDFDRDVMNRAAVLPVARDEQSDGHRVSTEGGTSQLNFRQFIELAVARHGSLFLFDADERGGNLGVQSSNAVQSPSIPLIEHDGGSSLTAPLVARGIA